MGPNVGGLLMASHGLLKVELAALDNLVVVVAVVPARDESGAEPTGAVFGRHVDAEQNLLDDFLAEPPVPRRLSHPVP